MTATEKRQPRSSSIGSTFVLVAVLGVATNTIPSRLWPWGLARPWADRMAYSEVDMDNDSLQIKHGRVKKLFEHVEIGQEPLMKGPETVIFGNDGMMYVMNEEGFLVSISDLKEQDDGVTIFGRTKIVADLGMGRPLGGKFSDDNTLYIADAHLGLIRVKTPGNNGSKVELVASRVWDEGTWSQILYANDVAIGPKTGMVYFTDSTNIASDRIGTHTWDTMYASKTDCLRGTRTGRLLEYNPETDEVKILARGFSFANGIAVDKEEEFLMFGETFTLRFQKYNLKTSTVEPAIEEGLPGFPDGLDCAWRGVTSVDSSRCFAAMPSSIIPILKLALAIPHPLDMLFRSLVLSVPKSMAPPVKPYGGVVEFDPVEKRVTRIIQDPSGEEVGMLTGVTVHDNQLFLGSLKNDYITIYQL